MSARTAFGVAVAWLAAVAGAMALVFAASAEISLARSTAEQLRDEVDLTRLRAALIATADDAMRPVGATVWLRVGSRAGR